MLAAAGVLAVAAATLGTGVYLNRESPTWQRILGTEPVIEAAPKATDELPVLLDSVGHMLERPATPAGATTTAALQGSRSMLAEHVELLTPGALAAAGTEAGASAAPPSAVPPLTVAEFSTRLAGAGNGLLHEALGAPQQEARRLSGAGFELLFQARAVLSAAGATQAAIDALPAPGVAELPTAASQSAVDSATESAPTTGGATTSHAALAKMPAFTVSGCYAPAPGGSASPDSGQLLAEVADAAYRMGYAYDVAGSRTSPGLRTVAWDRSELLAGFAHAVETRFAGELGCAPLRQAAYQLPTDAVQNPMDAARGGEPQLALLLRDAAATQSGDARAYLMNAAWAQALQAWQVTGSPPDFTQVEDATTASSGAGTDTNAG